MAQGGGGRGGGGGGIGGGIGGGLGGAVGGGGGGAAGAASGTRQYMNSTMLDSVMVTSDEDTRSLIVVTDPKTFEIVKAIIADLDKPKPQVLIDCVFVQVTHNNELDLGMEASYTGGTQGAGINATGTVLSQYGLGGASGLIAQPPVVGGTPSASSPSSNGAFYTLVGNNVNATIHALAAVNKTEVLSRPSILTRSKQQATILVGQQIPIVSGFTPIVSGASTIIENTVVQTDVGIILKVTPFITQDGNVEMIVDPETSSLSSQTVSLGNNTNSPIINIISADTVVVTPNNQTVVIGGLISTQNTEGTNKVPLLGDIPLLGYAFKYKTSNKQRTELIVFMTPHIVYQPSDLAALSQKENAKLEITPKAFSKEELHRDNATPQ
jgi:general secretion pathway protein D